MVKGVNVFKERKQATNNWLEIKKHLIFQQPEKRSTHKDWKKGCQKKMLAEKVPFFSQLGSNSSCWRGWSGQFRLYRSFRPEASFNITIPSLASDESYGNGIINNYPTKTKFKIDIWYFCLNKRKVRKVVRFISPRALTNTSQSYMENKLSWGLPRLQLTSSIGGFLVEQILVYCSLHSNHQTKMTGKKTLLLFDIF